MRYSRWPTRYFNKRYVDAGLGPQAYSALRSARS